VLILTATSVIYFSQKRCEKTAELRIMLASQHLDGKPPVMIHAFDASLRF
jgi:hypothetical protein